MKQKLTVTIEIEYEGEGGPFPAGTRAMMDTYCAEGLTAMAEGMRSFYQIGAASITRASVVGAKLDRPESTGHGGNAVKVGDRVMYRAPGTAKRKVGTVAFLAHGVARMDTGDLVPVECLSAALTAEEEAGLFGERLDIRTLVGRPMVPGAKWSKTADPSLLQGTERQWPVQIRIVTGHGRPEAQQDVTYLCHDRGEMERALATMEAEYVTALQP